MPLSEIFKKTKEIEKTSEKIDEKVDVLKDDLKEGTNEIKTVLEDLKKILQESIGVIGVYKDIIKSNRKTNITLFILIIILIATLIHNEREFTAYRENSLDKDVIIEILQNSTYSGE